MFRKLNLLSTFSKYYSQSSSIVPFSQFLVTYTLRIFLISPRSLVLKRALSCLQNQSRLELFRAIAARLLTYTNSLISRSTWTNKQGLALLYQKPYFVSLVFIKRFQSRANCLRLYRLRRRCNAILFFIRLTPQGSFIQSSLLSFNSINTFLILYCLYSRSL